MKQIIVAIFVCVAFSALVNAERKIAYDRNGKIFVANDCGWLLARSFAGRRTRRV